MAILQISRIQSRRGLQEDLPNPLASAELGWCLDTRRLYIGNGDTSEGAPQIGNTEILTSESNVLDFENLYTYSGEEAAGYAVQTGPSPMAPATRSMQNKFDDIANFRDFGGVGDGITNEVAAFNRAIEQLHKQTVLNVEPRVRRTLYIPAGVYKLSGDVIKMLPYTKLKGDGKNATYIIQTDATQNCVLSAIDGVNTRRGNLEIEGLTLANTASAKDIVQFDGVKDALLSRVRMQFVIWTLGDEIKTSNLTMPSVIGSGTSCVKLDASVTGQQATSNLVFSNCDFVGTSYAVSSINSTYGISNVIITGGYFAKLYQGLQLGDSSDLIPLSGIKVTHSTFDEVFRQAIKSESFGKISAVTVGTRGVVSAFNTYINVGRQGSATPGAAVYPVISYGGKNSYSICDIFEDRLVTDAILVELNHLASFATLSNGGIQLGNQQILFVPEVVVEDTFTDSIVIGVGYDTDDIVFPPILLDYAIVSGDNKRVGMMKITTDGVDVTYVDDYVESTDFAISMTPEISGGNMILNYDASSSLIGANPATFKVVTRTFI